MERYLYLDSSDGMTWGILERESSTLAWVWKEFHSSSETKASRDLHFQIYQILLEKNIQMKEIDGLVICSGPGSYTGMRFTEGFAQLWELEGRPAYSFYFFEFPSLIGIKEGVWISKAFKGEYFLYSWRGEKSSSELIPESQINQRLDEYSKVYAPASIIPVDNSEKYISSTQLLRNHPDFISSLLPKKMRKSPYYYRVLTDEFKLPVS